jgi:hypothetical protein
MKKTASLFSTCSALLAGMLFALPAAADINDLLEMSEKLDKIEKQDFGDAIDKANGCTRARDFACTSSWLGKASKLANGTRDKQTLAAAQQNMANEKARIAEEARLRAEEERRIAEAEERLRVAEAEAARRANESSGPSTGAQLFQLGMAIAGNVYAEKARLAAAAANSGRSQSGGLPLADLSAERRAMEKARADAATAQRARDQANASRLAQANATPVAPQRAPIADLREQTIGSRMAAANTAGSATVQRQAAQIATNTTSVYPTPQPTMQSWRENCPPGYSPMRHSNGVAITSPSGAACVRDPQSASGQASAQQGAGAANAAGTTGGAAAGKPSTPTTTTTTTVRNAGNGDTLVANTTKGELADPSSSKRTEKKIEWGPVQPEAIAVCRQSQKSKKWVCNGALDNQIIVDEPTLESALARQHCAGGTWAAGGPVIDGVQWEAYRCGHSLGAGDYDVAKRYNLITARRSYICPKYALGDGRCTTFYDGQDKR